MEYIDRNQERQRIAQIQREQDDWDDVHSQLRGAKVKKKSLEISSPDDPLENEADEVARSVVNGDSSEIHSTGGTISRKGEDASETTSGFESQLAASKGSGTSLNENLRSEMESKMSADFSEVKFHTDSQAHAMSEDINAKAFTHGQDIYFKSGNYETSSVAGKELLAHELVHTVQQSGTVQTKIQRQGDDPKLEKMMGDRTGSAMGSEEAVSGYNEGSTLLQTDEDEMGKFNIVVAFVLDQVVNQVGDPDDVMYKEYLLDMFGIGAAEADILIMNRQGVTWSHPMAAQLTVPVAIPVWLPTDLFIGRVLPGETIGSRHILQQYLINLDTPKNPITPLSMDSVKKDLLLLNQLPDIETFMDEYDSKYQSMMDNLDEYNTLNTEDENTDKTDYQRTQVDNTAVVRTDYSVRPVMEDRRQLVMKTVLENEQVKKLLSTRTDLQEMIAQLLLKELEGDLLSENTQTLNPEAYANYLDFQEQTILKSELYGELNVARDVYQKYWEHTWELLRADPKFSYYRRNSEEAEATLMMGGWNESIRKESIDHDGPLLWRDIIEPHINDKTFNDLKDEYPDIPYQHFQFQQMWWRIGGDWDYYSFRPVSFTLDQSADIQPAKPAGVPFLSDRDVADMLAGGFSINLQNIGAAQTEPEEVSLTDQIGVMVTQLETIRSTKSAIETSLKGANADGTDAIPMPAVLLTEDAIEEPVMLTLYLIKVKSATGTGEGDAQAEWKVMDFSVPTQATPTYTGKGKTDKDAIAAAVANFGQEAAYPAGDIIAQGPALYLGGTTRIKARSTGENWDQNAAGVLSTISTIAGVLGLVLSFTPLAPVGAGLLFVSGLTGASAAGLRVKDRIEHETFDLDTQTMLDAIDIVSGVLVAGKVANTALKAVNQASKGSRMAIIVKGIEVGTDVATAVIIGNQYLQRLHEVERKFEAHEITEQERDAERLAIFQEAAAVGLLLVIGYAAPKLIKRFGRSRNQTPDTEPVDDGTIRAAGGRRGRGWNRTLNGALEPNSRYEVDGYIYETDALGRVTRVSGNLQLRPRGRNTYQQGKSVRVKDGVSGDQGGHLIGDRFYGPGEQINYLPMTGNLNQGAWKQMENGWADAINNGQTVRVEITPVFSGGSLRPTSFEVEYWIGTDFHFERFNN